jgi:hypothetical protein
VTLDAKPVFIGFVFELVIVRKYSGQMPRSMARLLLTYAREEPGRRVQADQLRLVPTYEVGARCLLKWVGEKKSTVRALHRPGDAAGLVRDIPRVRPVVAMHDQAIAVMLDLMHPAKPRRRLSRRARGRTARQSHREERDAGP